MFSFKGDPSSKGRCPSAEQCRKTHTLTCRAVSENYTTFIPSILSASALAFWFASRVIFCCESPDSHPLTLF